MIREWINDIINGVGGLLDYERYEIVPHSDQHTAEWIIKCLANPKCDGSQQVLDEIIQRRISQLPEVETINRDNQVSFLYALCMDQAITQEHLDRWLIPALRGVDYGEIANVIVKLRADLQAARERIAALVESNDRINRLTQTLQAAEHALRSYQYGNTAPYLAQEVADRIQSLLREYQGEG